MQVIETTAHVGPDGMLRLEVPTDQKNQDVQIALVVEPVRPQMEGSTGDRWAPIRERLVAAGLSVPPPGLQNAGRVEPVELQGPTASEILVGDRR